MDVPSAFRLKVSIQADTELAFALAALVYDGLRAPPFAHHGTGTGILTEAGLTEAIWTAWVEEIARRREMAVSAVRLYATGNQQSAVPESDAMTALAAVSNAPGLLETVALLPPAPALSRNWTSSLDFGYLMPDEAAMLLQDVAGGSDSGTVSIIVAHYPALAAMKVGAESYLVGLPEKPTWGILTPALESARRQHT